MKSKQLSFMLVSLMAIVLAMGMASATLQITATSGLPNEVDHGKTYDVEVDVNYSGNIDNATLNWNAGSFPDGSWDVSGLPGWVENNSQVRTGTAEISINKGTPPKTISTTLDASTNSGATSNQLSFSSQIKSNPSAKITEGSNDPFEQGSENATINVKNDGNVDFDSNNKLNLTSSGDFETKLNNSLLFPLNAGNSEPVKVTRTSSLNFGDNTITITAENSSGSKVGGKSFDVEKSFCRNGPQNDTNVNLIIDEIENQQEGQGDSEHDEWYPLDNIDVDVEVENDKNEDMEDVVIEMGIYEKGTNTNVADNMIWKSDGDEEYEADDIDEDEEKSHTFEFQVDPSEFDSSQDYYITVKAYEEGEESNSCIDYNENNNDYPDVQGDSESYGEVSVDIEDDEDRMVAIDTNSYQQPYDVACGQASTISADVWNIGDEDFEKVEVFLVGDEFNITEKQSIGSLDAGDDKKVSFGFTIPEGYDQQSIGNNLDFITRAYEDEDDNTYEESEESFPVELDIRGQCSVPKANIISATLNQGSIPQSGGSFTMTTTIENTGESEETYNVGLSNQNTWVANYQTNRDSFTLDSGESAQAQISVNVRQGVSGNQSFNVQVSSNGEVVGERLVQVQVQSTDNNQGGLDLGDVEINSDSFIPILLALIALALIAIGIVLIARSSKGKKKKEVTPGVADF